MIVSSSSEHDVQNDSFSNEARHHSARTLCTAAETACVGRGTDGRGRVRGSGGGEGPERAGGGELRVQNRSLMTPSNIALG